MSSYYGIVFPEFWTGRTGRELRARGKDAQLLALYLATNSHTNMLGLYRLPLDDIQHETGLTSKAIGRAFGAVIDSDYARYDAGTWYVWVKQMARIRLGLKAGDAMNPNDLKATATNRIYAALDPNPFLGEFFDTNRRTLCLKKRRESVGLVVDLGGHPHRSGLPSPSEAPSKPVTGSGIRDQDQVQAAAAPRSRPVDAVENPNDNVGVITKLAHEALDLLGHRAVDGDVTEAIKCRCATLGIAYNSLAVGKALDSARVQRQRRHAS